MHRLIYIDKLKALAMLLVVWGHTMYFCMYHEQTNSSDPILTIICTFHVPLFFFLSGFVISTPPDIRKFLIKARKFLVPMIIVGFVNALLFKGVRDFFLNGGHFGYWYLLTLTLFYLMLIPFRVTKDNLNPTPNRVVWFLADSAIAIVFWLGMYFFIDTSNVVIAALNPWGAFSYWPFFIIGFFLRKYNLIGYITGKTWLTMLFVVAYLTLLIATFSNIDSLPLIISFIIALVAIAALLSIFHSFSNSNTFLDRQLLTIGNSTLDIYIYHYFFIRLINLEFLKTQSIFVELIVTVTLAIMIAYSSIAVGRVITWIGQRTFSKKYHY